MFVLINFFKSVFSNFKLVLHNPCSFYHSYSVVIPLQLAKIGKLHLKLNTRNQASSKTTSIKLAHEFLATHRQIPASLLHWVHAYVVKCIRVSCGKWDWVVSEVKLTMSSKSTDFQSQAQCYICNIHVPCWSNKPRLLWSQSIKRTWTLLVNQSQLTLVTINLIVLIHLIYLKV